MKRLRFVYTIVIVLSLAVLCGCRAAEGGAKTITVTIPPLKALVAEVVGDDYAVNIMLPRGASPESYSPTASQLAALENSDYIFTIGTMPFEQAIVGRLSQSADNKPINTSRGMDFAEGCCGHSHSHHDCDECEEGHEHGHHHAHHGSIDPHVWMSHEGLKVIVNNIASAVAKDSPDSLRYLANTQRLINAINTQMERSRELLTTAKGAFLIYHPTLGYIAKEYGLEQIALENEGKSPTPSSLAGVIERVQNEQISTLLYQQEYPLDIVQPIADILNVKLVEINPLSESPIAELERIINILSGQNGE